MALKFEIYFYIESSITKNKMVSAESAHTEQCNLLCSVQYSNAHSLQLIGYVILLHS